MFINEDDNLLKAIQLMIRLNHIAIHDAEVNTILREKHEVTAEELTEAIEILLVYDSVLAEDVESASKQVELCENQYAKVRGAVRGKIKDYTKGFSDPSMAAES
jgi:hypothetical protein